MGLKTSILALSGALLLAGSATADTLLDIYELALKNDAKLARAEATFQANREVETLARSALLPQVFAEGYWQNNDSDSESKSLDFGPGGATIIDVESESDIDTEGYRLSLNQTLFDLSAWFNFQSGQEFTKQARAQFNYDQQDLIIRVAERYFAVLRALDNLEATLAEERATQRQLEQTQQRFDVGLIPITDVHEARAVYDSTVVRRLTAEGDVGIAYEALSIITGVEHHNLWLLHKDFPVVDPDPMERGEWVQFALKNNYALQAAIYGMESARKGATAAKMEHAPTLEASFSYSDDSTDGDRSSTPASQFSSIPPDAETETQVIALNLNMPLYTGGRLSSQRRQAWAEYNAALQNKIDTQRTVVQSTRALHIGVTTDVQRVNARRQAIVSTSSALEATQAGYEVGTRNIVDVLEAQRALYSSIRDYANARYDYVLNLLRLKRTAGTLTPQDVVEINRWLVEPDAPTASAYKELLER